MMRRSSLGLVAAVALAAVGPAARAEAPTDAPIFMHIDDDGVPVFSDQRRDARAVPYVPGSFEDIALRQRGVPHAGRATSTPRGVSGPGPRVPAAFAALVAEAARAHGLPEQLLAAVIAVESGFNAEAKSRAGALGLMQLMPATAAELGVSDPLAPRQNVLGGARYLAFLRRHFQDDALALAAYNAGPGRVTRAGRRIPDIPETRAYVENVLRLAGR